MLRAPHGEKAAMPLKTALEDLVESWCTNRALLCFRAGLLSKRKHQCLMVRNVLSLPWLLDLIL